MAVGQGYSKTATNGLIFAYDTGDTRNSFLGRPTTNLMSGQAVFRICLKTPVLRRIRGLSHRITQDVASFQLD